ncbi:MAG: hypothetical protein PW734_06830 [Verrucomicrobium sp.]|nr:hypothetical protein [Verrucomicrobium sp.]
MSVKSNLVALLGDDRIPWYQKQCLEDALAEIERLEKREAAAVRLVEAMERQIWAWEKKEGSQEERASAMSDLIGAHFAYEASRAGKEGESERAI